MNRKLYLSAVAGLLCMQAVSASAQCPAGRYNSKIFPSVNVTTVTYSSVYSQQMDIYEPVGDTMAHRPLVVLAHGGSFVGGTRNDDSTVVKLCRNLAMRGYVTASIDYRLGNLLSMVMDSSYAIDVVIKAISDGKAAVRYFRQDAATTNTYKIDPAHVYFGGNSAGAVLYMHAGYLSDTSESADYLDAALAANGGMEGNSGNPGYSSSANAVINLAGALNSPTFITSTDIPSLNMQGDNDNTVPYTCAYPLSGTVHVNLCGMESLEPRLTSQGVYHVTRIFPGDGHVPWSTDTTKMNIVDSMVTEFLYNMTCTTVAGIEGTTLANTLNIYPNPATTELHITCATTIGMVEIYDHMGRLVMTEKADNKKALEVSTAQLSTGMYVCKITPANNEAPVVRRIVIE